MPPVVLCQVPSDESSEDFVDQRADVTARPLYSSKNCQYVRKHVPHSLRPVEFVAKRNLRERRRVDEVNKAFRVLKDVLPPEQDGRTSKMSILRQASLYIQHLSRLVSEESEELASVQTDRRREWDSHVDDVWEDTIYSIAPRERLRNLSYNSSNVRCQANRVTVTPSCPEELRWISLVRRQFPVTRGRPLSAYHKH